MNIADEIIISNAYRQLQEEIRQLQLVVAALTSERDELQYRVCPELTARYAESIGNYVNRIHYQEIMIRELRFRIQLVQAAINREQAVSQAEVDRQVDAEYQEYREEVDEESRQYEEAQREQRRRRERERAAEERWRQRYGGRGGVGGASGTGHGDGPGGPGGAGGAGGRDGQGSGSGIGDGQGTEGSTDGMGHGDGQGTDGAADGGANGSEQAADAAQAGQQDGNAQGAAENAVPDIKELYRKIVRRLHPDGNPDITEREKELFYKAVQAYKDGDIETLQEIYDEIFGDGTAETVQRELSYEELVELRDQLKARIESLQMEIDSIKTAFPYTEKEFLDDADQVSQLQSRLEARIHEYEETIRQLNQTLQELTQEMQNLKRRK